MTTEPGPFCATTELGEKPQACAFYYRSPDALIRARLRFSGVRAGVPLPLADRREE